MIATQKLDSLTFNEGWMILKTEGKIFKISIQKASMKLSHANDIQRELYQVSPSGYGIHWPLIDEDLAIHQLIKIAESDTSCP